MTDDQPDEQPYTGPFDPHDSRTWGPYQDRYDESRARSPRVGRRRLSGSERWMWRIFWLAMLVTVMVLLVDALRG